MYDHFQRSAHAQIHYPPVRPIALCLFTKLT